MSCSLGSALRNLGVATLGLVSACDTAPPGRRLADLESGEEVLLTFEQTGCFYALESRFRFLGGSPPVVHLVDEDGQPLADELKLTSEQLERLDHLITRYREPRQIRSTSGTTLEIHWPASRGLPDVERLNKDPDEIHGEEFALDFAALEALILPQRLADLGPGEAVAFDRLESDADHVVQARYRIEGGPSPTLWINDVQQPGNGASLDLTPQQLSALDRTLDAYRIVNASERPQEDMALAVYWVESRRTCGIELLWADPKQLPTSALRLSDLDALAGLDLRH